MGANRPAHRLWKRHDGGIVSMPPHGEIVYPRRRAQRLGRVWNGSPPCRLARVFAESGSSRRSHCCCWAQLIAVDAPPAGERAHAASFEVTTTDDGVDIDPGDGVCATVAGECSLRAAIQETNALEGADLILLPGGVYLLTIAGAREDAAATGDLDILDDVVIEGIGAEFTLLDAGGIDRYFHAPSVSSAVSITLRALTIENGFATSSAFADGGAILVQLGDLTIAEAGLFLNEANDEGGAVSVAMGGPLLVTGSVLRLNTAGRTGGAIESGVETTLRDTTIADNSSAGGGGGVRVKDSLLIGERVSVIGNVAAGEGGGLAVFRGTLHLSNSTISENVADANMAAGILAHGDVSELTHVTIASNVGGFGLGGPFQEARITNVVIRRQRGWRLRLTPDPDSGRAQLRQRRQLRGGADRRRLARLADLRGGPDLGADAAAGQPGG